MRNFFAPRRAPQVVNDIDGLILPSVLNKCRLWLEYVKLSTNGNRLDDHKCRCNVLFCESSPSSAYFPFTQRMLRYPKRIFKQKRYIWLSLKNALFHQTRVYLQTIENISDGTLTILCKREDLFLPEILNSETNWDEQTSPYFVDLFNSLSDEPVITTVGVDTSDNGLLNVWKREGMSAIWIPTFVPTVRICLHLTKNLRR